MTKPTQTTTKSAGDIPQDHRELIAELTKFEQDIDADASHSKERRGQFCTCMAHDYYQMDMDEEGNRLLLKAETVCPGYFKGPVIEHQLENPNFDTLVRNLTIKLVYLFAETLRNK